MNSITIPHVSGREALFTDQVPAFVLGNNQWRQNDYDAKVEVRLCYSDNALHIGYTVWEDEVFVTKFEKNDAVSADSCCEFFFRPDPDRDAHYINIEMNAIGTMLAKHNLPGEPFTYLPRTEDDAEFDIRTTLTKDTWQDYKGPCWQISYSVPFEHIYRFFPDAKIGKGWRMMANFYKCGHKTPRPHHLTWNYIGLGAKGFHAPIFFGEVLFG